MARYARNWYMGDMPLYFLGPGRMFANSNATPIVNSLYAIPFDLIMPIDRVSVWNKGVTEATPIRLGLYAHDPATGNPGSLIYGSGEIQVGTGSNGAREFIFPEVYQMTGSEWVAMLTSDVSPVLCNCNVPLQSMPNQEIFGHEQLNEIAQARNCVKVEEMTFGPLPDPFPDPAGGGYTTVAIWVRAPDASP